MKHVYISTSLMHVIKHYSRSTKKEVSKNNCSYRAADTTSNKCIHTPTKAIIFRDEIFIMKM
jgi:hypothetical protein